MYTTTTIIIITIAPVCVSVRTACTHKNQYSLLTSFPLLLFRLFFFPSNCQSTCTGTSSGAPSAAQLELSSTFSLLFFLCYIIWRATAHSSLFFTCSIIVGLVTYTEPCSVEKKRKEFRPIWDSFSSMGFIFWLIFTNPNVRVCVVHSNSNEGAINGV